MSIQKCNQICSSLTGSKVMRLKASKLKAVFNQEVSWDQAATWLRQHSIIFLKHLSAPRHTSFWAVTMYYIYIPTHLPIHLSIHISIYLPICMSINQSINLCTSIHRVYVMLHLWIGSTFFLALLLGWPNDVFTCWIDLMSPLSMGSIFCLSTPKTYQQ
jgi:hypothetical protein